MVQADYLLLLLITIITAINTITTAKSPDTNAQLNVFVGLTGVAGGEVDTAGAAAVVGVRDVVTDDCALNSCGPGGTIADVVDIGVGVDDGTCDGVGEGTVETVGIGEIKGVGVGEGNGVGVGVGDGALTFPITAKVVKCGSKTVMVSLTGSTLT